jgi:hypothetical protein
MAVCEATFKVDTNKLKCSLNDIIDAVEGCTIEELYELHQAGYIPTGVYNWVVCVKKPLGDKRVL